MSMPHRRGHYGRSEIGIKLFNGLQAMGSVKRPEADGLGCTKGAGALPDVESAPVVKT